MTKHIVFIEMSMTGAGEKAIEYSQEQGYHVTIVSRNPDKYSSILRPTTRVLQCETNNQEELVEAVKKLDMEQKIDGITTTADFYVPQAALAAEALGLSGMPYKAAAHARNKYYMRLNLQKYLPHLNPTFGLVFTEEEALKMAREWGFPLIAKPQDANDSLNVIRIHTEDQLVDYMRASKQWKYNSAGQPYSNGVLLEGYIEGKEFSVETVQHKGGKIQLIGVTEKVLTGAKRGYFVEIGVCFPTRTPESEILYKEVANALRSLNIDCGVIHTECRIKDGKVKILEINPRLMGDMAGSHMIELALGTSPIQFVVETALGNKIPWEPKKESGAAMYGICMPQTGLFGGIENLEEVKKMPGVAHMKVMADIGERYYYPPLSNGDFVARLVTGGETPEQALELAKEAAAHVKVKVIHQ
ncbi:ATP-grasp domain-containing protein [Effusibacillus consociatus]|uniref:ATP-grasp domain-containing protein n=1 Tax=Effusibacillus consociatus TaxID=1117041 RepID=A0ABV9Q8R0_9BACL